MLLPSFFSNNSIDDFFNDNFDDFFRSPGFTRNSNLMGTDIKEFDDHYEMILELPGIYKEDISINLVDGTLTVEANKEESKEEKDKDQGTYIRRERYCGKLKRSFYVGENVKDEDIYAKFNKGVLELNIPKGKSEPRTIDIN